MKNTNNGSVIHPGQMLFRFKLGSLLLLATMAMWSSRTFATLADYQAAVTNTTGIISYYTFDQTNANDSMGTYNGTPVNPAYAPGADGFGQGFLCNGNAQINFGSNSDFEFPSGSGTIEAWVRADWTTSQGGNNPTLWADGNGYSSEYSIHMSGTATKNGIGFWNGASYNTLPIPAPGTNWHHLVTVFDGGTFTVYLDGQMANTENQILGFNPYQFQLGNSNPNPGGGEGWIGMLDEVAIYSTALSSNVIQAHYQAFFSNTPPVIVKQPVGGTFLPGVPLTLSVTATGPGLTYQWFKGAGSLTGETSATLSFPSLSAADTGTYHVVVSNAADTVTSDDATVALGALSPEEARYQNAVTNEAGLISFYPFDGLTADDVFGPNNGTLQGSAIFASGVGGDAGQGLQLDGSGHVNLGTVPSFDFASGGTVEGWIRADWTSVGNEPCMFADRNGAPTVWSIHLNSAKNRVSVFNGSGSSWFYPPASAGTNWHHIATVFTNGTVSVYWDGRLIIYSPLARTLGAGPGTVQLGSSASASTSEGWIGMLDDVAFYSNALSAAQVKAHYDAFYQGVMPVITMQPIGGDFLPGSGSFSMSADAQGADLVYQWYKDGIPIPGATNLTIYTPSLAITNTGVYYFTASNSVGRATSSNAVLTVNADVARYQATVLSDPGLISYYTFDAGDAMDSYSTNNGTLVGSVTFTNGVGGVTNLALLLNGSSWINLGAVQAFDLIDLNGGTVEAWVNPGWTNTTGLNDDPDIVADRGDNGSGGSIWDIHMYKGRNGIGNWNNIAYHGLSIPTASGWHYLAVTFSGGDTFGAAGTTTIYWDGQLVGSISQPVSYFVLQPTEIGASGPGSPAQPWIGNIDEVALYSTVLNATDINNHYLAMIGPEPAPTISYLLSGNQITLSWPTSATGYTLESTPSLAVPNWTAVGGVVSNSVTVTVSSGSQFFRLTK